MASDNKKSDVVIGLYLSPKEICLAQVRAGGGKAELEHLLKVPTGFPVKDATVRPLALNNDFFNEKAAWVAALKQAVKKTSFSTSKTVVTLSPHFAILRYFVMPFIERRYWNKSIPLESKKYIPVSFDEVIYDFNAYQVEEGKKLGVLFGLTQRRSVEFLTAVLKDAGLDLAGIEITGISLERALAYADPQDHAQKAYAHFSGSGSYMVFSSFGYPVLYRETDYDASTSMVSKKLDVKGAVQFVNRYVGAQSYAKFMISGDGLDMWKPTADQESPMPVQTWELAKAFGMKDNDVATLFAAGAGLRSKTGNRFAVDISGLSARETLEKLVQSYAWNLTALIGGVLLLLSVLSQARVMMLDSKISSLSATVGKVAELEGQSGDAIKSRIDRMHGVIKSLSSILSDQDTMAPKLQAVAERIPQDLWVISIAYNNPFTMGEVSGGEKELRIDGETMLKGDMKLRQVDAFKKDLKAAEEFKAFSGPGGSVEFKLEGQAANAGAQYDTEVREKASVFSITCNIKRKAGI